MLPNKCQRRYYQHVSYLWNFVLCCATLLLGLWFVLQLPGKENFKNRNGKRLVKAVTGSVRGMTANKYHLLMIYRFLGDVVLSLKELEQEQLTQYASRETV